MSYWDYLTCYGIVLYELLCLFDLLLYSFL